MALDPLTAILNVANTVLDRVLPDKQQNDAAKAAMAVALVQGQFDEVKGQLQVNAAEAASQSVFVAGWRPAVGWVCGAAFAYSYVVQPVIQTLLVVFHSTFDPARLPSLNGSELATVLFGMLGLGAMRSYDKTNGTGNGH